MDQHIKTFWEKGNGNQLIIWSGAIINTDNPDYYQTMKAEYDVLGDRAAKEIFADKNFQQAYSYLQQLSQTAITKDDVLPESIKELMLQMQEVPLWLDKSLIAAGSDLSMRSGTNALICLRDYSLMGGYDYAYLNKALVYTGALKKGAAKRITDTLDFWTQVTRSNALEINHDGYQYAFRTRMIHSFSRIMIKEKHPAWDKETWGEPINFADMVATSIGFSLIFLHGLHQLGLTISEKEELGVFHLWKYIGYLLGIPVAYLPNNKKEATEIFYRWTASQAAADEDSVMLAKALENESLVSNIFQKAYQKNFLDYLHTSFVWFLVDKETCERLQISKIRMPYFFPRFRKMRNVLYQKVVSGSDKNYQRSVYLGNLIQVKISKEYLKAGNG
ncbi:oxygenase MpaB family protein [Flavobacterium aquidurense]|uniref:oxygenase MpaB family protein n=1 Tax=Flavobacterium aquidurense TaxID=362413 RepID=UPI003757B7D7